MGLQNVDFAEFKSDWLERVVEADFSQFEERRPNVYSLLVILSVASRSDAQSKG
jgi:hypothetical protein